MAKKFLVNITGAKLDNPLLIPISTVGGGGAEGGQINFARVTDGTSYWYIDSYGTTSSPALRFIENTNERLKIDTGGVIYFNGSAGTSGQVLTSQGTGTAPTWTTVGGSGTVTSITAGTGLSGGTITTTGTIAIDSTVATLTGSQVLTNKTLTDSTTFFQDETDNTKKLQFQLSGITTATTRTLTIPNVSGTIITDGDSGTVTNTMLAGSIANNKLLNSAITVNSASTSLGGSVTLYAGTTTLQTSSANQAMTGILSVTMPGSTSGTAQIIPPAAAGTGTVITLPGSTGTLALNNQTMFIGTTSVTINRSSASLALTGITSIDGSAGSVANSVTFTTSGGAAAGTTFNGSAARTIDYTTVGAAASGHNHSLDSLSNVTITSNTAGEILKWSGTAWINNTLAEAGIMSSPLTTTGDIIYSSSGTTAARLGIGTAGQALVVNSGATAPAWTTLTLENLPGAFVKKAVRVATTAALGGTYSNGTAGVGATLTITSTTTLDGVTLANGDRILVKDQATTFQNGIYTRTSATVLTRATDADAPDELSAAMVAVDEGTTNGGLSFDTDFKATDTIGTSAVVWNRMVDAGSTFYIGTTAITAGRTSASQSLTGITSIDGSAASVTNSVTFNNGGAGAASGSTFNGSSAVTVSYNTVGAAASSHTHTTSSITDLGTGVATFLATPSSANLAAAVTGETGSGALVFGTSPALVTPTIADGTDTTKRISFTLSGITTATTRAITIPDATISFPTPVSNAIIVVSENGTQTLTNKTITNLQLTAGTGTVSPLKFTSSAGTIKSTPAAGDVEFDGTRFLGTLSASTTQGKIGVVQAYRMASATSTSNATTTDTSMFGVGIVLESSTLYRFKFFIKADWSSGTANALRLNLASGAGTSPTIFYQSTSTGGNAGTSGPNFLVYSTTTGNTVVTDAINSATRAVTIEGFLTTGTSAGTWNPQFAASVAGATININTPTWFEVEKIGTSTTSRIAGAWI